MPIAATRPFLPLPALAVFVSLTASCGRMRKSNSVQHVLVSCR